MAIESVIKPVGVGDTLYLSRSFNAYNVLVRTIPTKIISRSNIVNPYLIVNPSRYIGLTSVSTVWNTTLSASANTQSSRISVSAFTAAHLHLSVSAVTGSWEIIAQSYDSTSDSYADVVTVFPNITAGGTDYFLMDKTGIVSSLCFKINMLSAGSITFIMTATLKGGSGIGETSFSQIIYLGDSGVTTNSGFPLLPGDRQPVVLNKDVELWGIADNNLNIRVLRL